MDGARPPHSDTPIVTNLPTLRDATCGAVSAVAARADGVGVPGGRCILLPRAAPCLSVAGAESRTSVGLRVEGEDDGTLRGLLFRSTKSDMMTIEIVGARVRRSVCLLLAWFVVLASPAMPAPPLMTAVASQSKVLSDALPSTFGLPTVDAWGGGTYAFMTGGQTAAFVRPPGASTFSRLLQSGDPLTGVPSSRVDLILAIKAGSGGTVALLVDYLSGDSTKNALLTYSGTTPAKVALSTDVAPASGGAVFGRTMTLIGVNASGAVSFAAPLTPVAPLVTAADNPAIFVAPAGGSPVRVVGPGATGPDTKGGILSGITPLAFNDLGEVLFKATVTGGTGGYGLFVGTTAGLRKIASTTDSNLVGGSFSFSSSSFSSTAARLNNLGDVVFSDSGRIYLSRSGQSLSVIVTSATTAPAPLDTRTVSSISAISAFNDSSSILFVAGLTGSNQAVLRYSPGSPLVMPAYRGQNIPGSATLSFSGFQSLSMNNAGDVAFYGSVTGVNQTFYGGVFKQPAGDVLALVVQENASTPGGVAAFKTANYCELLPDGAVYFESTLKSGIPTAGAFRVVGTTIETLLLDTDEMPGTATVTMRSLFPRGSGHYVGFVARRAGGHLGLFVHNVPSGVTSKVVVDGEYQSLTNSQMNVSASLVSVGAKGVVVFAATPSSTTSTSLYAWAPNQGLTKVVSPGDAVPGTAVTFWTVSLASSLLPPMNGSNLVLFKGTYSGGTGLFVAVPGQAPMAAVKSGDVVSGTETFTTNSFGAFLLNDAGQVVFSGPTSAVSSGIFVVTPGSSPEKIVAVGDTAPGGGTFASSAFGEFFLHVGATQLGEARHESIGGEPVQLRLGKQIALHIPRAAFQRKTQLRLGLHPFGNDPAAGFFRHLRQCPHHFTAGAPFGGLLKQAHVQLENVRLQRQHAVELRIAGAEVIDGDARAGLAIARHHVGQALDIAAQLSDLEHDALWIDAVSLHLLQTGQGLAGTQAIDPAR